MKTQTVTTYTAAELKEQFPDGFKRAFRHYQNTFESSWSDAIFDSLKAVLDAANIRLRDWSLGAYSQGNHIKIEFPGSYADEIAELSGPRAIAYLENNLFEPLRIPWKGKKRTDLRKYGKSYYAGLIKPCPLTGVCFDEDYLDALRKSVSQGDTLKHAFKGLADVYAKLAEAEIEYQSTEEYFIESNEDECFTEDGEIF